MRDLVKSSHPIRFTFAAWALIALAGCGSSNSASADGKYCSVKAKGDITLAIVQGYSQPDFSVQSIDYGVQLALAEINQGGGVHGKSIGLVTCDDGGDAVQGVAALTELSHMANIVGIVGPGYSRVATAIAPRLSALKLNVISPASTSVELSNIDDGGYFFRTIVSDSVQGAVAAAIAAREGYSKVFLPYVQEAYAAGLATVFDAKFTALGGHDSKYVYDSSTANYDAQIIAAAQAYGPNAMYLTASLLSENVAIIQRSGSASWTGARPRLLFSDISYDATFATAVGDNAALNGALGTIPATPDSDTFTAYGKRFQAQWNEEPPAYSANAYDAAYLFAVAMQVATDPLDGAQVQAALAAHTGPAQGAQKLPGGDWTAVMQQIASGGVDYVGASGDVDFDANGDVLSNMQEYTFDNGKIINVPPSSTGGCWTPAGTPCQA